MIELAVDEGICIVLPIGGFNDAFSKRLFAIRRPAMRFLEQAQNRRGSHALAASSGIVEIVGRNRTERFRDHAEIPKNNVHQALDPSDLLAWYYPSFY